MGTVGGAAGAPSFLNTMVTCTDCVALLGEGVAVAGWGVAARAVPHPWDRLSTAVLGASDAQIKDIKRDVRPYAYDRRLEEVHHEVAQYLANRESDHPSPVQHDRVLALTCLVLGY